MEDMLIQNVRIVDEQIGEVADVRVTDGVIAEIGRLAPRANEKRTDGEGAYLSAGFIDLHVHGGGGSDFMDATERDFETIAAFHAAHGTAGLLATTLTSTDEELFAAIGCFNRIYDRPICGASLLGLHLEGPYFSYAARGAQDPAYLRVPRKEHYEKILAATPHIRRWSAAPELPGTEDFAAACRARGILLSAGHTDGDAVCIRRAADEGFRLLTHFYSGMNGVTRKNCYRTAGAVEAGYLYDDLYVELIADGCHLPAELLSLALKIKGEKKIALVTDCSSAAGSSAPRLAIGSRKNGQEVVVKDGVAFLPDFSSFAGSVATTDRLLETVLRLTPATLPQAVRMLTLTPAELLALDGRKGRVRPGYDADLTLFEYAEGKIRVRNTFAGGREIGR